ncbi:hypothetical protein FKM82_016396 [Ascaphus truei]
MGCCLASFMYNQVAGFHTQILYSLQHFITSAYSVLGRCISPQIKNCKIFHTRNVTKIMNREAQIKEKTLQKKSCFSLDRSNATLLEAIT